MDLEDLSTCALFLDLDGTLIDIAATPAGVSTPEGLAELLDRLTRDLGGALAILTGRPIDDVDRLLAPMVPVAAGVHGAELRPLPHGEIVCKAEPIDDEIVQAVRRLASEHSGTIVETKRASVALHYRQAPALVSQLEAALMRILAEAPDHLILARSRQVLEIVPRDVSKGAALETIMELPAFAGRRPIMIGDDIPDLSALEAAGRLGGRGLKVAGEQFSRTEAEFSGPAEVRAWLMSLAEKLAA
jgi:trehalose 6-phosphate phosphatase